MTDALDDAIANAEDNVCELEKRIARQTALIDGLEQAGNTRAADQGRRVLATQLTYLDMWRADLAHLRRARDGNGS